MLTKLLPLLSANCKKSNLAISHVGSPGHFSGEFLPEADSLHGRAATPKHYQAPIFFLFFTGRVRSDAPLSSPSAHPGRVPESPRERGSELVSKSDAHPHRHHALRASFRGQEVRRKCA